MGAKRRLPTVYLDTSILSALHYKGGSFHGVYRATVTREWWEGERGNFRLYTSLLTLDELSAGRYNGQEAAVAAARRLPFLAWTKDVDARAQACLDAGLVPEGKAPDAIQLAFAVVYAVDYLLTWNHAHLANPQVQARLQEMTGRLGLRTPWVVTPDSIPKAAWGQTIRRKD